MFLRLVKSIISQERQVEALRECLFSHKGFNLTEAFRFFDVDGDGKIDETELAQGFAKHNIEIGELSRLVSLYDENKDGQLGYREFQTMLTPKRLPYRNYSGSSFGTVEERQV